AVAGSTKGVTLTASRHISFLARQLPGDRAGDYRAFLRAVQNDEAQGFTVTAPATTITAKPSLAKP
ncbi:MAG TPA: hypothetical protein VKF79_12590, partial [Candidatus Acidoferrum sp.]|nr:hypothetical protein [Candidatus Acidoferrum sp.]